MTFGNPSGMTISADGKTLTQSIYMAVFLPGTYTGYLSGSSISGTAATAIGGTATSLQTSSHWTVPAYMYFAIGGSSSGTYSISRNDRYTLSISSNMPNASVSICATVNGSSIGCESAGSTDSGGSWSLSGTLGGAVGYEGAWTETVALDYHGMGASASVSFKVAP